jgi:hypothetical protein
MADGLVPQASYVLSDGTPMVPADHLGPLEWAGGVDRLRDWLVGHWDAADQATAEIGWTINPARGAGLTGAVRRPPRSDSAWTSNPIWMPARRHAGC